MIMTTLMLVMTKNTPEDAGYEGVIPLEAVDGKGDAPIPLPIVFRTILSNKFIWLTAGPTSARVSSGTGLTTGSPRISGRRGLALTSASFQVTAWMIPIAATLGSILSGYISDLMFQGRRAPVAAVLYFTETAIILIGAQMTSIWAVTASLILIAFTCNATHSILGTAAAMDIGGRKMAGFAAGVIDSFQYIGAGIAGVSLGSLIDHLGWSTWLYGMAGFGILAAS